MALEYVVTKRVFGFDKDKNEKYVAKSVRSGRVSFSKMCGKVSRLVEFTAKLWIWSSAVLSI